MRVCVVRSSEGLVFSDITVGKTSSKEIKINVVIALFFSSIYVTVWTTHYQPTLKKRSSNMGKFSVEYLKLTWKETKPN